MRRRRLFWGNPLIKTGSIAPIGIDERAEQIPLCKPQHKLYGAPVLGIVLLSLRLQQVLTEFSHFVYSQRKDFSDFPFADTLLKETVTAFRIDSQSLLGIHTFQPGRTSVGSKNVNPFTVMAANRNRNKLCCKTGIFVGTVFIIFPDPAHSGAGMVIMTGIRAI